MPTPADLARAFQADIEAGNTAALRRLTDALAHALPGLAALAEAAAERVALLRSEGKNAEAATFAAQRSRAIAQQVEVEVRRLVIQLRPDLMSGQLDAVHAGLVAAEHLTAATLGVESLADAGLTWARAPISAVTQLVGGLGHDSPLVRLLDQIAPDTGRRVREALVSGMLSGKNPRATARVLRQEIGLPAVRAETIARTETLRAFRGASLASYQANDDIVRGFKRVAAHSNRTCPACLALDGKEQKTDQLLAVHPNDRCAVVPVTRSFRELGIDAPEAPRSQPETGAQWLARQPQDVLVEILGKGGAAAYQSGVPLSRFAVVHNDPTWGPSVRTATLAEVR